MKTNYNKPIVFHNDNIKISAPKPQIIFDEEVVTKHVEECVSKVVKAVVVNCKRLNVRNVASLEGKVLEIIPINSELMILEFISDDWAHVCTEHEIDGYVMAHYIKEV